MTTALLNSCLVIATTIASLALVFHPRVTQSKTWQATVTPLASIIGSGFLVLAPILKHSFGPWGLPVMVLLCAVAYQVGGAICFNIMCYDGIRARGSRVPGLVRHLERVASAVLVVAYVISVTYYLNFFGAFSVSLTTVNERLYSRLVTTAALLFVAFVGWNRGFFGLERIEEQTVGIKLGMIAGLLVGLAVFAIEHWQGAAALNGSSDLNWHSLTVVMGLIVTVQGFETSRYLGNDFDAELRVRTMRYAQWISFGIYLLYIGLTTFCFTSEQVGPGETAIVGMTRLVAPVLPAMLVAAALAAQFSAAVADTAGCGGLADELTGHRINQASMYLVIGVLGVLLTWLADIYTIIAIASRAFAAYYAFQCAIAAVFAWPTGRAGRIRSAGFLTLALLTTLVFLFGNPAEG